MNSMMRGITQKKANKVAKVERLEREVRTLTKLITDLLKANLEGRTNETSKVAEGSGVQGVLDDVPHDGETNQEPRGAVSEGQDSKGQAGSGETEAERG